MYRRAFATACAATAIALQTSAVIAGAPLLDEAMAAWAAPDPLPRYRYAITDLNCDGLDDAVVLVSDSHYCGSGGCVLVIFKGTEYGFEVISRSTITREPIFRLTETFAGWHTLSVLVSGGGIHAGQVLLRFNGETYPYNPSMEPRATTADLASAARLELQ